MPVRKLAVVILVGVGVTSGCYMRRHQNLAQLPQPTEDVRQLAARLSMHVEMLASEIGPRHVRRPTALDAAARYIEQRFLERGYEIDRQSYDAAGVTVSNIEARTGASNRPYLVVGAHYDTVPTTPGANDNASGVAVLLELAEMLSQSGHSVRFVAFANEEPPWFQTDLMGSLVYARGARARGDDIIGMIALETMGYYSAAKDSQQYPAPFHWFFPSTGHFLAAVSNSGSYRLLRRFTRAFRAGSPLPLIASPAPAGIAGVGWSDHWSFWQNGYRAVLLTDTAPYRYPHYHSPTDTPEQLDYVRLALATRGVAYAVRQLAPSPRP
jgi:Zn-dependent M28 family amino/carboxypeptidase